MNVMNIHRGEQMDGQNCIKNIND